MNLLPLLLLQASFIWSPDSQRLAYCGTQFSGRQELLIIDASTGRRTPVNAPAPCVAVVWNSRLLLVTSERALFLIDATNGHVVRTIARASVSAAQFSPDGRWISYVVKGRLNVVSVSGRKSWTTRHRAGPDWLYRHKLDMDSAYWWSPDSSSLAYLEIERAPQLFPVAGDTLPHVTVRIVDVSDPHKERPVMLPASEAYLPQIVWTPNSQALAIQRLDRKQTQLELFLADAATGEAKSLLKESDAYWINTDPRGLRFLPDGQRFLWTSERTGFRHIFLYRITGELESQVTHGDWAVTSVDAVNAAEVIYTATAQSPLERHVYRLSFKDGTTTQWTTAHGWHTPAIPSPDQSRIAFPNLILSDQELTLQPPPAGLLPIEFTTLTTHDAVTLNAMLIRPPAFDPSKQYPAIVLAPPGPQQQVVRDAPADDFAQTLARAGFVVFAVDGRGSGGRGRRFEEPLHFRLGGIELPDQLDALQFLKRQRFVDMKRIGIFGSGYAGMIALGAMMHSHGIYRAAVADAPITDWNLVDAFTAERYLGPHSPKAIAYSESSPNEFAKRLEGPLLILESGNGNHVEALRQELQQTNMLRPGRATIETISAQLVYRRALRFFQESLR